jgi:hypothetical protein
VKYELLKGLEKQFQNLGKMLADLEEDFRELDFEGVSILSKDFWGTEASKFRNAGFSFSIRQGTRIAAVYENKTKELETSLEIYENGKLETSRSGDTIYTLKDDILKGLIKYIIIIDYADSVPVQNANYRTLRIIKINGKGKEQCEAYEKEITKELIKYNIE